MLFSTKIHEDKRSFMARSKTDCFQLKADFLPITVLRLLSDQTAPLQMQLSTIIEKAPNYFLNAPIILDCTAIEKTTEEFNIKQVCDVLRELNIRPIAARGALAQDVLPILSDKLKTASQTPKTKEPERARTLVISKPVRAGTQIYAKDSDLIVLVPVNAGAEIIADGHIHVYAPLRGRALAGAQGDTTARIFCKELDAELISIAGTYLTKENIKTMDISENMVQVFLQDKTLCVEAI